MKKHSLIVKVFLTISPLHFLFQSLSAQFVVYSTSNSAIPGNMVEHIAVDAYGNKWLSSEFYSTVAKFNGAAWTTFNTSNAAFPPYCKVSAIATRDNYVWIGFTYFLAASGPNIAMYHESHWQFYTIPFHGNR